jgi:hypothetical protein
MEGEQITPGLLAERRINRGEMRADEQHREEGIRTKQSQTEANIRRM